MIILCNNKVWYLISFFLFFTLLNQTKKLKKTKQLCCSGWTILDCCHTSNISSMVSPKLVHPNNTSISPHITFHQLFALYLLDDLYMYGVACVCGHPTAPDRNKTHTFSDSCTTIAVLMCLRTSLYPQWDRSRFLPVQVT